MIGHSVPPPQLWREIDAHGQKKTTTTKLSSHVGQTWFYAISPQPRADKKRMQYKLCAIARKMWETVV